jgi:hypothetical protein
MSLVLRRWGVLALAGLVGLHCADAGGPKGHLAPREPFRGVPGIAERTADLDFAAAAAQEARFEYPPLPKPLQNESEPPDFPEAMLEQLLGSQTFGHHAEPLSPTPFPSFPSPPVGTNFKALDDNNVSIPPDTHGCVGPRHIMTALNTQVRIQDRSGAVLSTMTLNGFWAPLGNPSAFDPRVVFDPYNARWIFAAVANGGSTASAVLLAVSNTDDPTGTWKQVKIAVDATGTYWLDYPTLGFNKNWIVVSGNAFAVNTSSTAFQAEVYAFDKTAMYSTGSGAHTMIPLPNSGGAIIPAVTYDNTINPEYFLQDVNGNYQGSGYLGLYELDGGPGSELLSSTTLIAASPNSTVSAPAWGDAPTGSANFAPQLGSSAKIETNDSRIQGVVYRGGSLWGVHTVFLPVAAPTHSAVQWWEVSTTGAQIERGLIEDTSGTQFYGFPSIAVNKSRDVLLGYASFSSQQYASAHYALRMSIDPPNTLRGDTLLVAGTAPYLKTFGAVPNRWGDYSNASVDPVDDDTLWTVQEYAVTSNSVGCTSNCWATYWGQVAPSGVPRLAVVANQTTAETVALSFAVTSTGGGNGTMTYSASPIPAGASFSTSTGVFNWTPTYGQAGVYPLRLGVTNGTQSTLEDMTVTVTKTNRPPVFSTVAAISAFEGSTVAFTLSATDPDNDPLTYAAGALPGGATFTPGTRTFQWITPMGSQGSYTLPFTVTDGRAIVSTSVLLTIIHVNHPPVVNAVAAQTVAENSPLAFTVTAADPDNDPLTFSAAGLPSGATFDAAHTFSWTPAYGQAGTYMVTFLASDGALDATTNVTVTVSHTDRAPVPQAIANQTTAETQVLTVSVFATDPDGDSLAFAPVSLPAGAAFDAARNVFTWRPTYGQAGAYVVKLSVSDGTVTVPFSFNVTVTRTDRAPVITAIAAQTVAENATLTFTVTASDPDNDALTFLPPALPPGAAFDATHTFTWTPAYGQAGTYSATFTVSDGTLQTSLSVSIAVGLTNRPPVPDAIADQSVADGQTLSLLVAASDPDGNALTFASVSLPSGSTFDATKHVFTWQPAYGQAGAYVVKLSVSDGTVTVPFSFNVLVSKTDRPPVIAPIVAQTVNENATLTFSVTATDPDNDPLSFPMPTLPPGATFDATQTFTWTPAFGQAGSYTAVFVASDGTLQASTPVGITVLHTNRAPVVSAIADQSVFEAQQLLLTIGASDSDGDALTFAPVSLPTGATFDTAKRQFLWTPDYTQAGHYTVKLTVSDGIAPPVPIAFNVTVVNVDRAPVFALIGPQQVDEHSPLTFAVIATDPDGDPVTFGAAGMPPGATFDSTQHFAWTPDFGQAGTYALVFTASDGSLTATTSVAMTVRHVNRPPVITATDKENVAEGSLLDFTIQVADPDGDKVTVTAAGLPKGATLDVTNTHFTWTPIAGQAGAYPVVFTATDGQLGVMQTVTITVAHTRAPPIITAPATQKVAEKAALTFMVTTADADGLPLTLSAQSVPLGATFDAASKTFTWTPDYGQAGSFDVSFTATDGTLSASARTTITVAHTNQAPTLAEIGDKAVVAGHLLFFEVNATDPDADPLTFSATGLPTGAKFNPETRRFSWITLDQQAGKSAVTFTVSDGQLSDSKTVNLTVTAADAIPTDPAARKKGCGCNSGSDVGALALLLGALLRRRMGRRA